MFRKRKPPGGSGPGTLAIDEAVPPPRIHVIAYSPDSFDEIEVLSPDAIRKALPSEGIAWIHVQGPCDRATLARIAELFALHPLAMEDVVHSPQRPKAEPYEGQLFFVARSASVSSLTLHAGQVSLFLGRNYVLTFQEESGDLLDPVRNRIRHQQGLIHKQGAGYLAYAIIDAVIDGYYPVLESVGEYLEELEDEVIDVTTPATLRRINQVRRVLVELRHITWPMRDAVNVLIRDPSPLIDSSVRVYLRDCYDHCTQATEVIESYREIIAELTNTYLSVLSNRTNDQMRVLTVIASIFIPLTLLAGIYGMNFEYMPELHYRYGYPLFWAALLIVGVVMYIYFRRLGWIGRRRDRG